MESCVSEGLALVPCGGSRHGPGSQSRPLNEVHVPGVLLIDMDRSGSLALVLRSLLAQQSCPAIPLQACAANGYRLAMAQFRPGLVCVVAAGDGAAEASHLVRQICDHAPGLPCVVVSAANSPEVIYQFLQAGATDFLTPPLADFDVLPRLWRYLQPDESGRVEAPETIAGLGLIGRSPEFQKIVLGLPQVAASGASVLISGETGTGKEVVARAIHRLSPRGHRPFVPVNCGAIPVDLVENELFGHDRGAYTSAGASQDGLIAESEGGTLFLDEIDSLPLLAQVKLLRFLQEKEYRSLGSAKTHRADVRVITATNVDVERAVEQGRLRQDLYYRVNILTVALPPLRRRLEDVPLLAHFFIDKYSALCQRPPARLTPAAQQQLLLHSWPGNVRELEHAVERAVALASGPFIDVADLSLPGEKEAACSFRQAKARVVREFEHVYLKSLLLASGGNISQAAAAAQKDRRAFWELLRKHRIDVGSFKATATA